MRLLHPPKGGLPMTVGKADIRVTCTTGKHADPSSPPAGGFVRMTRAAMRGGGNRGRAAHNPAMKSILLPPGHGSP